MSTESEKTDHDKLLELVNTLFVGTATQKPVLEQLLSLQNEHSAEKAKTARLEAKVEKLERVELELKKKELDNQYSIKLMLVSSIVGWITALLNNSDGTVLKWIKSLFGG